MLSVALLLASTAYAGNLSVGTATSGGGSVDPDLDLGVDEGPVLKVVGGHAVKGEKWPDAAGIIAGGYVECTGVLVAPDVVLTAGHCADGITAVILGVDDYTDPDREQIKVSEIHEYPNSQTTGYDVTALVLAKEVTDIEPRVIANDCILDDYLKNGAPVEIVGYGAYDKQGRQYDSTLREAKTTITDYDCSDSSGCSRYIDPGGELGAGGDGVDACYGDSGGPLYLLTDKGDFLIGIVSRAYYDVSVPCGEGGIWVRADAVFDWVEKVTKRTLPRPVCNNPPTAVPDGIIAYKNHEASGNLNATDVDGNGLAYEITGAPAHGSAEVDADGEVYYTPDDGYLGEDTVTVTITDDGEPVMTAAVDVPVEVLDRKDYQDKTGEAVGCGCSSEGVAPSFAGLGALAGLLLVRRRR